MKAVLVTVETPSLCCITRGRNIEKVPVTITLVHPEDFEVKSVQELRQRKLKRMLREAEEQGGRLTPKILAQLLCCDIATIYKELRIIKPNLKEKRVKEIVNSILEIEPFKSNSNLREIFISLVNRYYSKKPKVDFSIKRGNRKYDYRNIGYAESVISTIAYILCGAPQLENKISKHGLKRILNEFEVEGIYIPYPSMSGFKKSILKVSEKLKIPKNIKTEILKDVEMKYRNFPKKLPYAACIAAIIYEKCLHYGFNVELNKISQLFGMSTEIVNLARNELRLIKPEERRVSQEKWPKKTLESYSKIPNFLGYVEDSKEPLEIGDLTFEFDMDGESNSDNLKEEMNIEELIDEFIENIKIRLNNIADGVNPEIYARLNGMICDVEQKYLNIEEFAQMLEELCLLYDEPLLEELKEDTQELLTIIQSG